MIRILCIGDVVGTAGCDYLMKILPDLRRSLKIDMTVINGENSADGNGITEASANRLFDCGADVITTGNHAFRRWEALHYFDECPNLIRPANLHPSANGIGWCVVDFGRYRVAVVNLLGRVYLDAVTSPFDCIDALLPQLDTNIILVDFHAEATSEKKVMGYYLDGRVSAVFGTHTHVQTADETILENGTAYITDVGMTGAIRSVLGVTVESATRKMLTLLPTRFQNATSQQQMNAILLEIDEKTGKTHKIERVNV